jgi:hypothetical protein
MALPLNTTPTYTLTVPSTGNKIKYRPFLVKEEKALLIAQQSEDPIVMVDSLKNVLQSCIQDKVDVNSLATFDLEYIFTQVRAKSVGEIVDLQVTCDTCTDDKAVAKVSIDLTKLEVNKDPAHTNNILLYGDVGVILKYPSMDIIKKLDLTDAEDADQIFDIVISCIDSIYTTDELFAAKEQTKAELEEFLNNLTNEQFSKIQAFFSTMPRLKHEVDYTCPVCNKEHHKVLEGLQSFF